MATICNVPPNQTNIDEATDTVVKAMADAPVSRSLIRSVAGAYVGNLIDKARAGEDEDVDPLFTALGLMAGSKTAVKASRNVLTRAKSMIPESAKTEFDRIMEIDKLAREVDEAEVFGLRVDPRNKADIRQVKEINAGIKDSLRRGRNVVSDFFRSPFIQSQFSYLKAVSKYAPSANKLSEFLQSIPTQIRLLKTGLQDVYNGSKGAGAFDKFTNEIGPQKIQEVYTKLGYKGAISTSQAKLEMNAAIWRLLHTGRLADKPTERLNVMDYYSKQPAKQALDNELMNDAEFLEYAQTYANWFKTNNEKILKSYNEQLVRDVDDLEAVLKSMIVTDEEVLLGQTMRPLVKAFADSDLTWMQFKQSIEGSPLQADLITTQNLLDKHFKNSNANYLFGRIRDIKNRKAHHNTHEGSYVPQYEDSQKMKELYEKAKAEGRVQNQDQFEEWVTGEYWKLNRSDKRLFAFEDGKTTEELEYAVKSFNSQKAALKYVEEQINRRQGMFTQDQMNNARRIKDQFIKEGKKIDPEGNQIKTFYLETPESLDFNLFEDVNKTAFASYFKRGNYNLSIDIKPSSRLDRMRRLEMPVEFAETNMEKIFNQYANDVAPRLAGIDKGVMDAFDLQRKYITPITKELQEAGKFEELAEGTGQAMDRVIDVYNTTMRINQFGTLSQADSFQKQARVANFVRNMMAMAYQWGIGFYNVFEHAVQSPLLTSWDAYSKTMKAFLLNPKEADAFAEYITSRHIINNQLSSQGGNYSQFAVDGANWLEKLSESGANLSANFSFTNTIGKSFNKDYKAPGLFRLAVGSFVEGNIMSTAINTSAALNHAKMLSGIYKELQSQPTVLMGGKRWNMDEVMREFGYLGINEDNIRGFMNDRTQSFLYDFMGTMKAGQQLTPQQLREHATDLTYLDTIMNYATESYQATNPLFRPEKAVTPTGRLLFQYSTYGYNQILQNVQMRIRQPLQEWTTSLSGPAKDQSILKFHYHYGKGNFDELKKMGFTDEMINSYPVGAMSHVIKYTTAMGVATVGNMSIDGFRDLIAYPFKEDEQDQWRRTNRRKIINPLAPVSEQMTVAEAFEEFNMGDMLLLGQYLSGMAVDTGLLGRFDAFYSSYGKQSIVDLTPISREANTLYKELQLIGRGGLEDISDTASGAALRTALRYTPIAASSPLSELKGVFQKRILEDPRAATIRLDGKPLIPELNFSLSSPELEL